jgi:endoglucanase
MLWGKLIVLAATSFAYAKVQFLGVAIAGGDFGCLIDGTCPTSSVQLASDGAAQMQHFVSDGMNLFRIRETIFSNMVET